MLGAIERERAVQVVVPHGITAEAGNILSETAIDKRSREERRSDIGRDPRDAPGGCAVPEVLQGGVVVEGHAVDELVLAELGAHRGVLMPRGKGSHGLKGGSQIY
jgi:hypothetical protein